MLDTGRFIEAHAWGREFHDQANGSWEIKPLVEGMEDQRSRGLDDAKLKKEVTSLFRGLLVCLQIPPGSRIKDARSGAIVADAGTAYFSIERCHLSTGLYDDIDLEVEEDNPPKHDVSEEFRLRGKLWSKEAAEALLRTDRGFPYEEHRLPRLEVPGRWITAELTPERTWKEVPRWEP
jgi:hypothetical protein